MIESEWAILHKITVLQKAAIPTLKEVIFKRNYRATNIDIEVKKRLINLRVSDAQLKFQMTAYAGIQTFNELEVIVNGAIDDVDCEIRQITGIEAGMYRLEGQLSDLDVGRDDC